MLIKVGMLFDVVQLMEECVVCEVWVVFLFYLVLYWLWQLFLKGYDEVVKVVLLIEVVEMVLLCVIYVLILFDLGEFVWQIVSGIVLVVVVLVVVFVVVLMLVFVVSGLVMFVDFGVLVDVLEEGGVFVIVVWLWYGVWVVIYVLFELVLSGSWLVLVDMLVDLYVVLKSIIGMFWKVLIVDVLGVLMLCEVQDVSDVVLCQIIFEFFMMKVVVVVFLDVVFEMWFG